MLKCIEKGDYHAARVKGYAAKYLTQLKKYKRSDIEIEMIDYEVLWGMVLKFVKR